MFAATLLACLFSHSIAASEPDLRDEPELARQAAGQTVYFNAWGGDFAINRYIDWVAGEVEKRYDIRLVHVKVTDIAEAVSRIRAEYVAGREQNGSVDLMWINGENFAAMQHANLLWGPWAEELPNSRLIDWQGNPTTRIDATLPTGGYELPWGTATFTLFYDREFVSTRVRNPDDLLCWIEAHPGRFTYPQPPAFLGTAFLKQLLILLTEDTARLQEAPGDDFQTLSAPLWAWLDRAHASMWRTGRLFPRSGPAQRELLAAGELDWMMSYNPAEASRAIRQGLLQDTVAGMVFSNAALSNSHFLAIPANASAKEGALLVANFLISPLAQIQKADEARWGDPSVLDPNLLTAEQLSVFERLHQGGATAPLPKRRVPEPHPGWSAALERAWLARYTR